MKLLQKRGKFCPYVAKSSIPDNRLSEHSYSTLMTQSIELCNGQLLQVRSALPQIAATPLLRTVVIVGVSTCILDRSKLGFELLPIGWTGSCVN